MKFSRRDQVMPPALVTVRPVGTLTLATCVSIGGFLFGYDIGVIANALPLLQREFHLDSLMSGAVVSAILLGAMVGAACCGVIGRCIGRRVSLMGAAAIFVVGATMASMVYGAVSLIVARFVLGIAVGVSSTIVPLYIGETAPTAVRGRLITINQLMITVGILVSYGIGMWLVRTGSWRTMFLLIVLPGIVLFMAMLVLPESPRWLVSIGRTKRAEEIITTRLPYLSRGLLTDKSALDAAATSTKKVRLFERWMYPALVAGIGLQVLGQLSGVNTVIYYAPILFAHSGVGKNAVEISIIVIGTLNCAMTIVGMVVIDKIGRKKLLIGGAAVMAASLLALALVHVIFGGAHESIAGSRLSIGLVWLYVCAVASTLNTVVFVIPAEIYPARVRTRAMGLTLYANWSMNFIVALTFLPLLGALGYVNTFAFYGVMCVALGVFGGFCIPETRGRTLEVLEQELVVLGRRRALIWHQ